MSHEPCCPSISQHRSEFFCCQSRFSDRLIISPVSTLQSKRQSLLCAKPRRQDRGNFLLSDWMDAIQVWKGWLSRMTYFCFLISFSLNSPWVPPASPLSLVFVESFCVFSFVFTLLLELICAFAFVLVYRLCVCVWVGGWVGVLLLLIWIYAAVETLNS